MSEYKVSSGDLTNVADAIRTKGGTSAGLSFPDGFVSAIGAIPTGGGSTLITKNITANGTYEARDDDADGYSEVTVHVQASPIIRGTFTGQSTDRGSAITINVPYVGSGYPIAGIIYPSAGAWKSDSKLTDTIQKYAMIQWIFSKIDVSSVPDYLANTEPNQMEVLSEYKSSDSDATSTNTGRGHLTRNYYNTNAIAAYANCIRFKNATSMSVYIADTSYGFMDGVEYTYIIVYSS